MKLGETLALLVASYAMGARNLPGHALCRTDGDERYFRSAARCLMRGVRAFHSIPCRQRGIRRTAKRAREPQGVCAKFIGAPKLHQAARENDYRPCVVFLRIFVVSGHCGAWGELLLEGVHRRTDKRRGGSQRHFARFRFAQTTTPYALYRSWLRCSASDSRCSRFTSSL